MPCKIYKISTKLTTGLEDDLEAKKRTNYKWMIFLTTISIFTIVLVGVIIFFSVSLESKTSDECGLVYYQENLKIINGIAAVPHSWPAQVLVFFKYYVANFSLTHPNSTEDIVFVNQSLAAICAGTLINRWTVMTASHCILKSMEYTQDKIKYEIPIEPNEFFPTYESMFTIYLGMHEFAEISKNRHKIQKRFIKKIIMYPNFDHGKLHNDITLFKLEKAADLNKKVQIACLPEKSSSSFPPPFVEAYAIGWGRTKSTPGSDAKELRNTLLTVLNDTDCRFSDRSYTSESKFCAADLTFMDKSVCHGDSGGSLYVKETVGKGVKFISAGIVSYGYKCGNSDYPGYFTRVSFYLDWIRSHLTER